jgi:hypothetical protein
MNVFDRFDPSLGWKLICVVGVTTFVLVAIILGLLGLNVIKIFVVEAGVITAWLGFLALYGLLIYLSRHTRRS